MAKGDYDFDKIWEQVGREIEQERAGMDERLDELQEQSRQLQADLENAIEAGDHEKAKAILERQLEIGGEFSSLLKKMPTLMDHGIRALIAGLEASIDDEEED